mgnify:CR=1 FL=1|jgi:hypothetical protein|tara:strand:- start:87545 stop:87796 length:252 start_codon:yes stop_codon:yes gene_type:complete
MNQPTQLKPIPTNATKAEIRQMYERTPEATVRRAIQYAVETVNEESNIKFTKRVKTLNSKHIKIIVEELGTAEGYEEFKNEGL